MERNLFAQGTAPNLFENSGINKIGDTYYYSYGSNFDKCNGPIFKLAPVKSEIT